MTGRINALIAEIEKSTEHLDRLAGFARNQKKKIISPLRHEVHKVKAWHSHTPEPRTLNPCNPEPL